MPRIREISSCFLTAPFLSCDFVAHGYSEKILRGRRFRQVHPRVWAAADHVMTEADRVEAARLFLPSRARVTGITRIRQLGLEMQPDTTLHFVIDSDLHVRSPGIMLHRTISMPPADERAVTPAAAFIAYAVQARRIDLTAVGDWLLHRGHMSEQELGDLLSAEPWRDGAREVQKVLEDLDGRSRSIPESKVRLLLRAAGVVGLEVNVQLRRPDGRGLEVDLLATTCGVAIEYEGSHHQVDRSQYLTDIDRYAALRGMRLPYHQVTKEAMRRPRVMVLDVYDDLVAAGYTHPQPVFGAQWHALFEPVRPSSAAKQQAANRAPRQRIARAS